MPDPVPLCVDLDGTLIRSDLLQESFAGAVRHDWLVVFKVPFWLLNGGRCRLKSELAARAALDIKTLPYRSELVDWLRAQHQDGRRIVLATAATKDLADQVAGNLSLFDQILSTDGARNLKGAAKLGAIQRDVGATFDYIGDCGADRPILAAARTGYLIRGGACRAGDGQAAPFALAEPSRIKAVLKLLRPLQWTKNALIILPLIFAHELSRMDKLSATLRGVVAFCLTASAVYVLNDFLDLQADRQHRRKRNRPLASGAVPLIWAPAILLALLAGAAALCLSLPWRFAALLALYALISGSYSFFLKTRLLVDVMVLAGLYTLRIIAGGAAARVPISPWLLAFSMFMFSSLAFAKRFTELRAAMKEFNDQVPRRSYVTDDLPILAAAGIGCGLVAVMVLALYINSDTVRSLYAHPEILWLICPLLLYWNTRVWFLANRGTLHDDPVVFAMTDRISWLCAVLCGGVVLGASVFR